MTAGDISAGSSDPAENLALDEALLRAAPAGPLIWIWRNPACVVVGRGQKVHREVRTDVCAQDGIPVLRRASGGGTVFHDDGNLNVTLVLPDAGERPLEAIGELMSGAVSELGLPPRLGDRGLFIGEAKLCGFAVFRTKTGLLAHSTLLVHTAAERVGRYLTGPPPDPKPLDSHRSQVASLAEHGLRAGIAEAAAAVRVAAARQFDGLAARPPSAEERDWQRRLLDSRYRFPDWHADGRQKGS
ncbi:lipoate-protein ligase A [Amycolatopsis xylanica]|uniref:Lipoate-protein ligase A n=1 Tax=Amycolatopsis xylanica TaxID=589385 RepID=A0A1H3SXF3_9PSEU|nr:lipoate--protein ligase family protein [Amycolatopsis xylanica]SDZ42813.1 lipoate-protein ligase A [Amycolatopsis xylanica]